MIVHLLLFRPRADSSNVERRALFDAFTTAVREIPTLRRARIGRRVRFGYSYESLTHVHLSHAALLEFDDAEGLRAYLEHPTHAELGNRFLQLSEELLIYDLDVTEGVNFEIDPDQT